MAAESQSYAFEVVTVDRVVTGGRPDSRVSMVSEGAGGVELTWEDLWVTTSKGNGSSTAILAGLTGFARPCEVLAIMGPSGCGKSTLLDALSGRLGSQMNRSGLILVNGRKQALAYGTLAYVTQEDVLMTTLTVGEAICYSAELLLPDWMSKSQKRERAEQVIMEMGLQDAMETRIGGRNNKGISGGQRRRVSICIEILTHPKLLFLDEPTSGLDSAASYHVMSRIVNQARQHGGTIIASIHQPCFEVFELFDNLCLLCSSKTIYFGPISLTNQEGAIVKKESQASFTSKCLVLTKRSFVNMYRDLGYYWLRLAIYFALCLSIGTVFYDIGHTYGSIQARGSMLMFMAAYLTFMAIGGFPSFVEDLKIFHRERLNGHYGPTAFTVANMLSSSPFLLLISIIPASAAYYLVGLQRDLQHFIFFALILYSSMLLVEGLMMIVANIVPDFLMGIITWAGIQGGMLLASGFFRLPNDLPRPVWKYPIYYIAFHKYANQGYFKNEFLGLTFQGNKVNSTVSGEEVVRSFWQMEVGYSKWVDLAFLIGMAVAYRLLFLVTFKVGEVLKIVKQRKMKEMCVITGFGCDG